MKITLDLPDELMRQIERCAVQEGRTPNEVAIDLLRAALTPAREFDHIGHEPELPKTLPLMKVRPASPTDEPLEGAQAWCEWLKNADLGLDVERFERTLGQ